MSMRRSSDKRDQVIVRTSIIGIVANIFLAGFKFMVGILTHSIAITLDAVNNLSDVLSSVITIIGTKLAGKSPDKKHPYGHGRYEYLAAIIIAVIVLYAGISALIEAIKSILHPAQVNYTPVSLVIVVVAVVIKLLLGNYVGKVGKKVGSDALIVSGADAKFDAIISTTTLLAAIIFLLTGFRLEAYLAAVIAILLIKSSFEMLNDTISLILGQRANAETSRKVKEVIQSVHGVKAVYDLIFNDYGPNLILATAHIEVPDTFSADQIDTITDKEAIATLFSPSFSTADKVSDVSGRGVGLDVVKTNIESLGGTIECKTERGAGSSFTIRLPLTLAIVQALMVELGTEKYAIPLGSIQTIEEVTKDDIKYVQSKEVISLRGTVIPLIRLDTLLDVPEREANNDNIVIVIVRKADKLAGLVVDGLIGQQEIVIKSIGKYISTPKLISGSTILGDGEVALILDANVLL